MDTDNSNNYTKQYGHNSLNENQLWVVMTNYAEEERYDMLEDIVIDEKDTKLVPNVRTSRIERLAKHKSLKNWIKKYKKKPDYGKNCWHNTEYEWISKSMIWKLKRWSWKKKIRNSNNDWPGIENYKHWRIHLKGNLRWRNGTHWLCIYKNKECKTS